MIESSTDPAQLKQMIGMFSMGLEQTDDPERRERIERLLGLVNDRIKELEAAETETKRSGETMNAKVNDLMTECVVTTEPHVSVERVRGILEHNQIGAIPVVPARLGGPDPLGGDHLPGVILQTHCKITVKELRAQRLG